MRANKSLFAKLYAYPYDSLTGNELRNNVSEYGPKHICMFPCELGIGDLAAFEYLEDKGVSDLGELDKDFKKKKSWTLGMWHSETHSGGID